MKVIVLGAGLIGIASAYFLRQQGHTVTVIDRQAKPAAETSFANGGQISVSNAEPWANPGVPLQLLRWLGRTDAPLRLRLRMDPRQWRWGMQFLLECRPGRTHHNTEQLIRLGTYSREVLRQLRRERGLANDHRAQGILHFYTSPKGFENAAMTAAHMRSLGCDRRVISADEAVRIEPALRSLGARLVGATFTAEDESGDANCFARELAGRCDADGVQFLMSHTVTALREAGGQIDHVEATDEDGRFQCLRGDAYVLALGGPSTLLAKPLGIELPIYPLKGYSVTMPVKDPALAYQVSLSDEADKLVFSRLGDRLRIAGTAELSGHERSLDRQRCEAILKQVEELFPGAGDTTQARFWTGLRPATPGNVPIIGRSRLRNLFLNTGHGSLGWTLSCGSGKSIARIVSGLKPEADFMFVGA